jgi:isoleucyl-tRNA synthetase
VWRKEEKQVLKPYSGIIKDELNVKEIIYTENVSHYQSTFFKLNFKTAGAAFAKLINAVKEYVDHISDTDKKLLLENEQLQINIQGQTVTIEKKHLHVAYQVASGFEMAGDEQLKVILDITLTPQLVDEGQVRELIRVIQDTRKKLDLPIEKYISIKISTIDNVKGKIRQFEELIKENILVHNITYEKLGNSEKHFEVTFDNEIVKVSLIY